MKVVDMPKRPGHEHPEGFADSIEEIARKIRDGEVVSCIVAYEDDDRYYSIISARFPQLCALIEVLKSRMPKL